MKLAYSTNAYMRYPIAEAIRRIASLGYGGVELMADAPHAWPAATTDDDIDAIRRTLDAHRLVISNVNAFMMNAVGDFWHPSWIEPDVAARRRRLQHTVDALTLARKLGAPSITTEPGGPLPPGTSCAAALDLFVEGLNKALCHAQEENVRLLVEPEPGLLVEKLAQFEELAQRIESPMFGLNFDIGHFYCVGESLPDAIVQASRLTSHYHIEDIAATRAHEHLIPGHGAIDFPAVLKAISDTQYDGWLTVELYPYVADPDAAGREALNFLEAIGAGNP
ncbi:MAG: sugar phosphate isomerase/epimerase family protein [Phycisphaerae bacterium]